MLLIQLGENMRLRIIFLMILFISGAYAQSPSVKSIMSVFREHPEQYYRPQFSPDDSRLLLTKSNFQGLYDYHLDTGILNMVTAAMGAGYQPTFSADGQTIYYRTSIMKDRRNYFSLVGHNTITAEKTVFEAEKRELSPPQKLVSGNISYTLNNNIHAIESGTSKRNEVLSAPSAQIHKSRSIRIIQGAEDKTIQPKGEGLYLWPSISPDGTKLLFTMAGVGTFISDLDGNIISELGLANAPSWSPDGNWIVFMRDTDDGYTFTDSDIYIASTDGSVVENITGTSNIIELYPNWSYDGNKIVCSTDTGDIYLINLEWK